MILSQAYLSGLLKGFAVPFKDGIANTKNGHLLVPKICAVQSAAGFANMQYDWNAGVLLLKEVPDSGMQQAQNLSTKQKTVNNVVFSRLLYLAREKLERNQAAVYNRDFSTIGNAFALTLEHRLKSKITASTAFGTTDAAIFKTSAAKKAPGKESTFTNSGTKKFSTANFDTALEELQSQTDTEGNNLNLGCDGNNVHLVVGPKYRKTAAKCVGAKLVDGGDENVNAGVASLHTWGLLSGALAHHWFLFDTSVQKPGVQQDEFPLSLYMDTDPSSRGVIETGKFVSQAYYRGEIDILESQYCWGSTGVDAA